MRDFFEFFGVFLLAIIVVFLLVLGIGTTVCRAPARLITQHTGTKITAWQYFCSPMVSRQVSGLEQQPLPIDAKVDAW